MSLEKEEPDNITAGGPGDMQMMYVMLGCGGCAVLVAAFVVVALLVKLARWAFF